MSVPPDRLVTTVSVVVPATDSPATLTLCLAAIRAAFEPPEEIIVVHEPKDAGPAEARNLGASRATEDILVFVDADVEVAMDAFRRIRRGFEREPKLMALFGSYDDAPTDPSVVSGFRNLLHHHVHQSAPGRAETFWAGLGAIRREVFLSLGGFDVERFPYSSIEDIELGMRLVANGSQIVLDPAIQGKHLKRWTIGSMVRTDLLRRGVPWVRLLLASGSAGAGLNLAWRHRVSALASIAFVTAVGARRIKLAGPPLVLLLALNRDFYALVLRKRGLPAAAAAVPLHIVHHLTSAAAVPLGIAEHVFDRDPRRVD